MKVGIVGSTGLVGQQFIRLLSRHPYFEISELVASEESANKPYEDAVENKIRRIPEKVRKKSVSAIDDELDCRVIFSALPSKVAREAERDLVERGHIVLTNASAHRMESHVPLVIPEVNPDHIGLIEELDREDGEGFIVANPNCSVIQLAIALKPIHEKFGIKKIDVVTLQALSGAGYDGVGALEAADNVIPYIPNEEEKIKEEIPKLFGELNGGEINREKFRISSSCNRVNISDGHLENVSIELEEETSTSEVKKALEEFRGLPQDLPSSPETPIKFSEEKDRPQPRVDLGGDTPMSVHVGRLREDNILDYKFIVLGHNTIRGAAGASILNAELLYSKGLVQDQKVVSG
ncbi:MAG: aspartate-semialdehyde dehydrogenase [Candidatus Thermoplasmatota archaeon]|nr:aspartate-semialdehyde dehydrogenase [Candidatus Thermoplasmatota archaeon]